jgi:cell wall-associated NlpC family hydrolase
MPRFRHLLSVLCVAFALAVALLKPLTGRADPGTGDGTAPDPPGAAPTDTQPVPFQLPVVKGKRRRRRGRAARLHIPLGTRVAQFARHLVGVRYTYGGSSPRSGFDCSGFVRYVYGHFGVVLPHSSYAQFDQGRSISRASLRPGDLVFFDGMGHVGMYVGNGRFIHAPRSGTRVRIETLAGWYGGRFSGARRLRSA